MAIRRTLVPFPFALVLYALVGLPQAWAESSEGKPNGPAQSNQAGLADSYVAYMSQQGPVREITLKDAIQMALTNNLDIAIENYNEDMVRTRIDGNGGFFDPRLGLSAGWKSSELPTSSLLQTGRESDVLNLDRFLFEASYRQNLVGGGKFEFDVGSGRLNTSSIFAFINPSFDAGFKVSVTQPLWRGFRETGRRRQLRIYALDAEMDEIEFESRVSGVIEQVRRRYWELVYAVQSYEARRQSLEVAVNHHRDNKDRVELGTLAELTLVADEAEVSRREQALLETLTLTSAAQNALADLLAPNASASIWSTALVPTDQPSPRNASMTLTQAIDLALANSPELSTIDLRESQNQVDRDYYENEGKPAVNLRGAFGSVGLAGTVLEGPLTDLLGGNERDPVPTDPRFGGLGTAWKQALGFDYVNWEVAVDVDIPLKNRTNEADLTMTRIRQRQLAQTRTRMEQSIMIRVKNAAQALELRNKKVESARLALRLSQERLEGEKERFALGRSTNFEILRLQRDLTQDQVNLIRVLVDSELALLELEASTQTILKGSDVAVARAAKQDP